MIEFGYLSKGLNAMARAHHMSSMAGHLGASFVAAYFLGEQQPRLDPAVVRGLEDDLGRVGKGESVFGKKMSRNAVLSDPELFADFPEQKPDESLIDGIAESLAAGLAKPRQSGHNVIFASLAIRGLKEHPELATPAVVDGIIKLMKLFKTATPGSGYYGKAKGRIHGNKITIPEGDDTPQYEDVEGMVISVLDEMNALQPEVNRSGYGGMVHIINHAAAIAELAKYGYSEIIPQAVRSHREHLRLWRNLPDVAAENGPLQVGRHTPDEPGYWKGGNIPYDRALLTHRVKTMYGFHEMAAAVDEEKREKAAYDKMRYLM